MLDQEAIRRHIHRIVARHGILEEERRLDVADPGAIVDDAEAHRGGGGWDGGRRKGRGSWGVGHVGERLEGGGEGKRIGLRRRGLVGGANICSNGRYGERREVTL